MQKLTCPCVQSPEGARQPTASLANLPAHRATSNELDDNSFPAQLQHQHRRASSAGSEISLSSVVSTTGATSGAYTGFTQHGQYDLTRDVILRGEFISDQQAKVTPDMPATCCIVINVLVQPMSVLQAVIVCIRIATYIGVTILVVALSYKLKKV